MKWCPACHQHYEDHILRCADCPDTLLASGDDPPPPGRVPGRSEPAEPPDIHAVLGRLFEARLAGLGDGADVAICGACALEVPYGETHCPECGEEIWYEQPEGDDAELGDQRLQRGGWVRVLHADRHRLETLAALLAGESVRVRVEAVGRWLAGMDGQNPGAVLCALDVHADDLDLADEFLAGVLRDPADARFDTSHLDRVELDDVELAEALVAQLGVMGVEADRLQDGERTVLLLPGDVAEIVRELVEEFAEEE